MDNNGKTHYHLKGHATKQNWTHENHKFKYLKSLHSTKILRIISAQEVIGSYVGKRKYSERAMLRKI